MSSLKHKKGFNKVDWFVIIILIIHVLDALISGFEWSAGWWPVRVFVYVAVLVFAFFVVFHHESTYDLLAPTVLAVFLPLLRSFTEGYSSVVVWAFLLCFPVWFWYIYFFKHDESKVARGLGKPFLIFIIIIGTFALLSSNVASNQVFVPGADVKDGLGILKGFFVETPKMMVKNVVEWGSTVGERLNNSLNINRFTGSVEDKEGAQLGVFIENIFVPEENLEEGQPVLAWATLRSVSFESVVTARNWCYAMKGGDYYATGTVSPEKTVLAFDSSIPLDCRFNSLEAGTYKILFVSEFSFPTDAYVTYALANQRLIWEYKQNGRNLGAEHDVEPVAEAKYSGGPVMLGMRELSMPVGVSLDQNSPRFGVLPNFGMTLEKNAGYEGEIVTINEFKLISPKDVGFSNCVPEPVSVEEKDNVDEYYFSPTVNTNYFTTINCNAVLENPLASFAGQDDIVYKTFLMSVDYTFRLSESTSVRVKSIG